MRIAICDDDYQTIGIMNSFIMEYIFEIGGEDFELNSKNYNLCIRFFNNYYIAMKNGGNLLWISRKKHAVLFSISIIAISLVVLIGIFKQLGIISGLCLLPAQLCVTLTNLFPLIIYQNGILYRTKFIEWNNIENIIIDKNLLTIYQNNNSYKCFIHNPEILISILKETIKFLKIEVKE